MGEVEEDFHADAMAFAAYQPDEENAPPPSAAMNKVNGRALESGVTISPEADKELEGVRELIASICSTWRESEN